MIIRELHLKNFGKFCGRKLTFSDGINLIYGPNEAGKTTVYHAICAMFFGLEKQRGRAARSDIYTTYQPWENRTWYEGTLRFETGGKKFCLERGFYHNEKFSHLFCETDGEELSLEDGDLEMLLGDVGAELYYNTAAVGQLRMKPQDIVYGYLKNHISKIHEAGSNSTDVVRALSILENKKKMMEKERKQKESQIGRQLENLDTKIELMEKEAADCIKQLEALKRKVKEVREKTVLEQRKGIFERLLNWLRKIFFRKSIREKEQKQRDQVIKLEENIKIIQEILGEKESLKEEFLLEKDVLYEVLHEQSKDSEIKALDLAMERIRELSTLKREEVMTRLLAKTSNILAQITNGKYQKLILKENEEPTVWDGCKMLRLFQLSTGCVDQVYLALRIGLQDLFFEEDTLPLMFDDAFVYFDDDRLKRLLFCLKELNRQVILFSCHKRELDILKENKIPFREILI